MTAATAKDRPLFGAGHPNEPQSDAAPALADHVDLEATLQELLAIMARVATGDFSVKPTVRDGEDALSRFVVAFRFLIDDLERAHLERQDEIRRLRALDALKTRFINLAAHELNTPLTPMRIHLHMLKGTDAAELTVRQRRAVEALDRNMARMGRSVGDLLDVARLQSQRFRIAAAPTDLSALARTVVDDLRSSAEANGLVLDVAVPARLPVEADEDRITQVLYNLLTNAFKFTPRGGRIQLHVRAADDHAVVSVVDNGAGLTPIQIQQLFHPFVQVHPDHEQATEGTGLGLFISKGIIEAHGGRMWCDSAGTDRGARFSFVLPKRPGTAPAAP